MNSLFDTLGKNDPKTMISQIKKNPMAFLSKAGMNVPQGMNDPNVIIQHLVQSGQVPQSRVNQVMQIVNGMKR